MVDMNQPLDYGARAAEERRKRAGAEMIRKLATSVFVRWVRVAEALPEKPGKYVVMIEEKGEDVTFLSTRSFDGKYWMETYDAASVEWWMDHLETPQELLSRRHDDIGESIK